MLADIGVVTDLAISADDRRAFDHRAVFHNGAFADKNLSPMKARAFALVAQRRLHVASM